MAATLTNRKAIHKNGQLKFVSEEDLASYLADGWELGRTSPWNKGLTKETDERVRKYGLSQQGKIFSEELKQKLSEAHLGYKWSEESIQKRTETRKHNGFTQSTETRKKISKRLLGHEVSLITRQRISERVKGKNIGRACPEDIKQRISQTHLDPEFKQRVRQIKLRNGTLNTSKPEVQSIADVQKIFGEKDVVRHYFDKERYPFECDCYIKSLDLFIEFNYHWTHGPHKFNPADTEDMQKLAIWRQKQDYYINSHGCKVKNFYYIAEEVWTVRDINKYQTAEQNKLNYLAFYSYNDFKQWLTSIIADREQF